MDEEAALEALDGSRELLSQLATIFSEDVQQAMSQLEQAVATRDAPSARLAAHSIRGLASIFYAPMTIEVARRLEAEAAAGALQSLRDGGVCQLRECVQRLLVELEQRGLLGNSNE